MTTVPKLSYTNLKSKNKHKNEDNQELSLSNRSSDLFAHMNQDNLTYIQNQIKEKRKKTNLKLSIENKRSQECKTPVSVELEKQYPPTPELLSPTAIPSLPGVKTEGENNVNTDEGEKILQLDRKYSYAEPEIPNKKYVEIVQKRCIKNSMLNMSDLQQKTSPNYQGSDNTFLNFLQNYIDDLNEPKIKNHSYSKYKQFQSGRSQMKNHQKLKKNKQINKSHQLPRHKQSQLLNTRKIEHLEQQMLGFKNQMHELIQMISFQNDENLSKSQCCYEKEQIRSMSAFGNHHKNMDSRVIKKNKVNSYYNQNCNYLTLGSKAFSQIQQKQFRSQIRQRYEQSLDYQKQKEEKRSLQQLEKQFQQFLKNGKVTLKNQTHRF